jgi:hypothetical protein
MRGETPPGDDLTVSVPFHRRRTVAVILDDVPPPTAGPVRRPARAARMLALAHNLQAKIARGTFPGSNAVARHYGLTGARLSQLLSLLSLAPDIQDHVLQLEAIDAQQPLAVRALLRIARELTWEEQRRQWNHAYPTGGGRTSSGR